jgi:hypothetical protein
MSRYNATELLAEIAEACGWNVRRDPSKPVLFHSHDGTDFPLPSDGSLKAAVFDGRLRTILRHSFVQGEPGRPPEVNTLLSIVTRHRPDKSTERQIIRMLRDAYTVKVNEAVNPALAEAGRKSEAKLGVARDEAAAPPKAAARPAPMGDRAGKPVATLPPSIVKLVPHDARGGEGRFYRSNAVNDRHWSDGTVDYACAWHDCTFSHAQYRNVAAHYGSHLRGQGTQPTEAPYRTDQEEADLARHRARIERLTRELEAAASDWDEENGSYSWRWMAEHIVLHRHWDRTGHDDDAEARELTADEIIERIGRLIDNGKTSNLLADNQRLIDEAAKAAVLAAEAETRAAKAEGNLQALRDLLNEEGTS